MRYVMVLLFALLLIVPPAVLYAQDDLLYNGGMEEGGDLGPYQGKGRGDLNVPAGWDIWLGQGDTSQYYNRGDKVYSYPHNGPAPNPIEGRTTVNVHGGYVQYNAALFQTVSVPAGTNLTAEAASYLIACDTNPTQPGGCPSDPASGARTRIGIDPDGGTDPAAPEIVWSTWVTPHDQWGRQTVTATAAGEQVTVFLYATQDSPQGNNYSYWDDAKLYEGGEGGTAADVQAVEVAPSSDTTSGNTGTVATLAPIIYPTATRRPPRQVFAPYVVPQTRNEDGALIHIVQQGETFDAIAYAYGLTREQLLNRNPTLPSMRFLRIGQEIVIVPEAAATEEATADITATPTVTATPAG